MFIFFFFIYFFFFFNDTATTEIYTLSLHDALPIWATARPVPRPRDRRPKDGSSGSSGTSITRGSRSSQRPCRAWQGSGQIPEGGHAMTETVSGATTRKGKATQAGRARLRMQRIHTTPGVHPYD